MLDAELLAAIAAEARQAFLEEDAPECLTALNQGLQELEQVLSTDPSANQRFSLYKNLGRAAHSLKGGAGMAELPTLNHLCHKMEDVFEALEQRQLAETAVVFELLVLATQEVQTLIDLAIAGQEDTHTQTEIALSLESFLTSHQTTAPPPEVSTGISSFVKTALDLELEDCLARVEKVFPTGDVALLQERFQVLAEECTLLGQALSCPWLETIIQETQSLQAHHPFIPLLTTAIAEIRHQRHQFLAGTPPTFSPNFQELSPQTVPTPPSPPVSPSPVSPSLPLTKDGQGGFTTSPQRAKVANPAPSRQNLRVPLERLTRMSNTVSELLINHERLLTYDQQIRQASRNLKQRNQQLAPLREQVESLYDELTFSEQTRPVSTGNGLASPPDTLTRDFDALQFDRYTAVHGLLQRFQELMVQVQEIQEDIDVVERELQETLIEVRQSLDHLDSDLTESRLVAFGMLAKSFIQPLEQLSDRHQKPIQIRIEGENTLVELAILEQLRTPLTHLLRNAFDHGLETPQERRERGKDPQGTLTLGASLTHNQVVIRVADDGRGINFDKIRHRAVELGLLEAENSQFLSQEALLDCLFAPGFSTVSQVSDLSGRGLGLDIVKHLVEGLRGRLHLETQPDQGTCFVIQIPLTLNILPLLLVRSQQRLIAFPSQSILRAISLKEETHKHQVRWQEQLYPVRSLAQLLPYGQTPGRLPQENQDVGLMVNLKDQIAVLAVDQIVDERPLVVKALDAITPLPPYLIGCTVLGTGEVIPIFAPENFERLWQQLPAPLSDQERAKLTNPDPSSSDKTTILVIDDSITVRRTLQRVLSRSGYEVIQCRDGKEAWELLGRHQEPISMAFCDLEMPNMDGYSLLQLIRGDQQWRSLPVVMLTSRENETHRQRAMDLGANHYLTKPFQPNQLLALVATFVQSERS